MFGVYFINHRDKEWTLVATRPTLDEARYLMKGFRDFIVRQYGKAPNCLAVSEGHDEPTVPRDELSAVTGRHF